MSISQSKSELFGKPVTVTLNIPKDGAAGSEFKEYMRMGYVRAETRVVGRRVIIVLARKEIGDYPGKTFRERATNYAMDNYGIHRVVCGDRTYRIATLFPVPSECSSAVVKKASVANFETSYQPGKRHMHVMRGAGKLTPTSITDLSTMNGGTRTFDRDVESLVDNLVKELNLQLTYYMDPIPLNERTLQAVLSH